MDEEQINMLRPRKMHGWQDWQNENDEGQWPKQKRSFLFYFIPGLILVMILTSFTVAKKNNLNRWPDNPSAYDNTTLQPKKFGFFSAVKNFILKPDDVMIGQKQGRINILLMGIGGPGHDGPYLSDTNIILSIKPDTNEVAMISVPRDLSAKIEGYGWGKINHANAYGEMKQSGYGGEFARQTFEQTFGISIPYFVRVDFQAFIDIINTVGSVEIDIPRSFVDYSYPGPNYSYKTIRFEQGKEKMDGQRALEFARSRKGTNNEGSDFARAKRQQIVIAALKNKLLSADTYLNPLKIKKIIDSLSEHILTNIDFGQIMYLASLSRKIDDSNIKTLVLDNGPNGFLRNMIGQDGAYLLAPKSGNFDSIKLAMENIFSSSSTQYVNELSAPIQSEQLFPSAKIEIQNATWHIGIAARKKQQLENGGFGIYTIGNSEIRPLPSSTIYVLNNKVDNGFITALSREANIPVADSIPSWLANSQSPTLGITASQPQIITRTTSISFAGSIEIETTTSTVSQATSSMPDLTSGLTNKYDPNTDILIILGEDVNQ
ncbi:MAG: LCP family protein [bacterium]